MMSYRSEGGNCRSSIGGSGFLRGDLGPEGAWGLGPGARGLGSGEGSEGLTDGYSCGRSFRRSFGWTDIPPCGSAVQKGKKKR